MSLIYQDQKQAFTGVYSRLHENAFSWVSFLIMLQAYSLKKDSLTDFFLWVLRNNSEHFFAETRLGGDCFYQIRLNTIFFVVVTVSAKYHFLCSVDLTSKMLLSTFVMFWQCSWNIFRARIIHVNPHTATELKRTSRFPVIIFIWMYLLIASFQTNLLNSFDFRADQKIFQ